ncbi:MAG: hypothetical protein ACLSA0_25080 [Eisenbergiella massiliensis]
MEKLLHTRQKPYYETENEQLYLGDSFRLLLKMEPESVDMIFADPPYFFKQRRCYLSGRENGFGE